MSLPVCLAMVHLAGMLQNFTMLRSLLSHTQVYAMAVPQVSAAALCATSAGAKRKRRNAPTEACPYCHHTYTVRDGLSSKLDGEGNRMHLRRCQCRWERAACAASITGCCGCGAACGAGGWALLQWTLGAAPQLCAAYGRSGLGGLRWEAARSGRHARTRARAHTHADMACARLWQGRRRRQLRCCHAVCREKTPPCKNCPTCKAVAELMAVGEPEEQQRLCQDTYRCQICACK
jgi:hypothetical protein